MSKPYGVLLAGFGQMASGYGDDPRYVEHVSCPTHAHALKRHPGFDWLAVVDPLPAALEAARSRWGISRVASSVSGLERPEDIEVAVLATPPDVRLKIVRSLPGLKAVLVEKPLAENLDAARVFLDACRRRDIRVQVNITRRGDTVLRELANDGLSGAVGEPRAVFGVYGNGLANMATHSVDLVRMLLGEVRSAQALPGGTAFEEGPLAGDVNLPFVLTMESGLQAAFMPLRFKDYREVGLDVWGSRGRLQLMQEGLVLLHSGVAPCRSFSGVDEVPSDRPEARPTAYGEALYVMYDNLHQALEGRAELFCSGNEALATMRVVVAVRESHSLGGAVVDMAGMAGEPVTVYFAHDPGAAELMAHLYANRGQGGAVLTGQGYAPGVYRRLGLPFREFIDTDSLLAWLGDRGDMVARIVSGTSQSADADCRLWRWASERGIDAEAHVDHWMHPVERFSHLDGLAMPDRVHVMDEDSRRALIEAGADPDRVYVSGQPVMEAKARAMADLRGDPAVRERVGRTLRLDDAHGLHVFVSENVTELGLRPRYGFDEMDSFLAYRAHVDQRPVVVKVHPKESEDKWRAFLGREGIDDCPVVTGTLTPEELVAVADSVGGMFSILLLEASLAGIPVVSCQPGLKTDNPMDNTLAGEIRMILSGPPKKEWHDE